MFYDFTTLRLYNSFSFFTINLSFIRAFQTIFNYFILFPCEQFLIVVLFLLFSTSYLCELLSIITSNLIINLNLIHLY